MRFVSNALFYVCLRCCVFQLWSVTLDNAACNGTFVDELDTIARQDRSMVFRKVYGHIRCMAHVMNLAVQDAVQTIGAIVVPLRDLVKTIKNSHQYRLDLEQACVKLGMKPLGVLLDVATRWNSTFTMIERAICLREALNKVVDSHDGLFKFRLSPTQWQALDAVKLFLEPFLTHTEAVSGDQYSTLGSVIPLYNLILDDLEDAKDSAKHESVREAAGAAYEKFLKYYQKTSWELCAVTVFDPRFKFQYFLEND
jgi:hypothetical protein